MNFIKRALTSRYFQPIMSALAALEAAIIAIIGWIISYDGKIEVNFGGVIICLGFLIMTIWLPIFIMIYYRKNNDKNKIISCLCEIQNNYLITPEFKTSQQHAEASKEKNLSQGGTAKILTNSLTYDMSSVDDIAHNVINGAKYIYILPTTNVVIRSIENYIEKMSSELGDTIQSMHLLKNNLQFCFFDENIACLYNFATLIQTAAGNTDVFDQAWWYINPIDNLPSSYMLAKEINSGSERKKIDEVFAILERNSFKCSGKDIFDNLSNLEKYIRRW